MGFNAGLFILTQNEAQLAGVVSHELGHVVLRHSAEMMASSNVNSIPMWIGIFAGLLAGQTEASIASIQSGIGFSVQKNINLVRENEIESDIMSSEPPNNCLFEYLRAIGPSIISPNAERRMQSIAAQI